MDSPAKSLDPAAAATFIRRETALIAPTIVPELRLHLVSAVMALWEATEETLAARGVEPPFWAVAWPGGQAVARHLLDHPELVRDRSVLDIGAGSGLAALAALKAGARHVTATDIDPLALQAVRLNAAANDIAEDRLSLTTDDVIGRPTESDIILSGDLCYERTLADRLMPWLRAEAARGAMVILADPGRNYRPTAGLALLARYAVPTSREIEDKDVREAVLWQVLPSGEEAVIASASEAIQSPARSANQSWQ